MKAKTVSLWWVAITTDKVLPSSEEESDTQRCAELHSYKDQEMWGIRDRFEQKPNETAEAWPLWLADEGALLVFVDEKEWMSLSYPKANLVLQASMAKCISADDMSMEEEHVKTTQSLLQWVFTFIIK